ncbi:MFS transporter [Butyrivibrio sp. VCD2006]|uniref:MFS transporter n=1 Tax=Butyrivibrio sp. VCD2006 TaxID=1280664 RepID=UPI00041FF6FC|nr:MFS transporter [Butyrivibrio sp. VCD2006]
MKNEVKNIVGISMMSLTKTIGEVLISSFLAFYLTDYFPMEGRLGSVFIAATLLPFLHLLDAATNPIQGWLIDWVVSKGKKQYRFFCAVGVGMVSFASIMIFHIPKALCSDLKSLVAYIICFYLIYDFGSSFFVNGALIQTMTMDYNRRISYILWPRLVGVVAIVPFVFMFQFVEYYKEYFENQRAGIGMYVMVLILVSMILSLIGVVLVNENKILKQTRNHVTFHVLDIFRMVKKNKPFAIYQIGNFFVGFIYVTITLIAMYYVKWNYCYEFETGYLDSGKFACLSMILGIVEFIPFVFGTLASAAMCKKENNPVKGMKISIAITVFMGVVMEILQICGQFAFNSNLYFAMLAFLLFGCGMAFLPGNLLAVETMDYALWKTGKPANATIESFTRLLSELQKSGGLAFIGALWVVFGYEARVEASKYLGSLDSLQGMLQCFGYLTAVIPIICGALAFLVYGKYPLTVLEREKMIRDLEKRKENAYM